MAPRALNVLKEFLPFLGISGLSPSIGFEIIQQIFNDQISSAEQLSSLAGRGVGMGAIKNVVEKMGGNLWMESEKGLGSKLIINVPHKN